MRDDRGRQGRGCGSRPGGRQLLRERRFRGLERRGHAGSFPSLEEEDRGAGLPDGRHQGVPEPRALLREADLPRRRPRTGGVRAALAGRRRQRALPPILRATIGDDHDPSGRERPCFATGRRRPGGDERGAGCASPTRSSTSDAGRSSSTRAIVVAGREGGAATAASCGRTATPTATAASTAGATAMPAAASPPVWSSTPCTTTGTSTTSSGTRCSGPTAPSFARATR